MIFTEQKSYFKLKSKIVTILKSWDSITTILSLMLEANITITCLFKLKATLPNDEKRLQDKFTFTRQGVCQIYLLPINVCMETYLRDIQYKVLNYITCTNVLSKKLVKVDSDVFLFCNFSREDLEHLLFVCPATVHKFSGIISGFFWYDVMKEDITLSFERCNCWR